MLTPAQIEARKGKLTASRVACLMRGDRAAIMQLYLEMIGEAEPENLDHVWAVRLGSCTEQLQLDWYEAKNTTAISRRGEVVNHPHLDWAACTLDGWIDALQCPIEAKHVGGREPLEVIVDRYQWQLQWQMECTGASQCALSVIVGANEPVVEFIPADPPSIVEMIARGQQFMRYVELREPPVVLDPVAPPQDWQRVYNMTGDNEWANFAATWLSTRHLAVVNEDAAKILKGRMPEDAKKAYGYGVQITRDRAGRKSLREEQHER